MSCIMLNGKKVSLPDKCTLFQIKGKADVCIINGYQTDEDAELHEGDQVILIHKGVFPQQDELECMMAARHTPNVHEKVKRASVAVAGLGGLGSNIALMLARTGVGRLLLVDFDVVEPSNLNRQCYAIGHLGMQKCNAMLKQVREVNPYIEVKAGNVRVDAENAAKLFDGYEIVCEAFDDPACKAELVNTVLAELPGTKIVAGSGMAGYGSANKIQTRKVFERLYVCGDGESEAKNGRGLMAPLVTVCAAHQANMVLRLILGLEDA